MVQDSLGFIWIGTIDGLNRYDGSTFIRYKTDGGRASLLNNHVQHLTAHKGGKIWISTNGGLSIFDEKEDNFRSYTTDHGLLQNTVNATLPGPAGTTVVSIYRGGIQLLHPNGSLEQLLPAASALSSNEVSSMAMQGDSVLWVGTFNGGLNKIRWKDKKMEKISLGQHEASAIINHIYTDTKGNVWIGSLAGLYVITTNSDTIYVKGAKQTCLGLSDTDVLCMKEDSMGRMWIGTRNGGLNIVNRQEFLEKKGNVRFEWFLPREDGASVYNRTVSSILKDRNGNMWLGTSTGINFVNPRGEKIMLLKRKAMNGETLAHSRVGALEKEKEGTIWIGTDGGGLNLFDAATGTFKHFYHMPGDSTSLSNDYILSLKKDSRGRLWVGTYRGGINRMDPASGKCKQYLQESISKGSDVRRIFEDAQRRIWVGTNRGGLYRYEESTDSFMYIEKSGSMDIRDILQDQHGGLWLATFGDGIGYYHPEKDSFRFYNISNTPGLSANTVFSLAQVGENEIWAGTEYGGLVKLNIHTGKVSVFTEKDGLANNTVNSLVLEDSQNMWVGTLNGVSHLHIPTEKITRLTFPESNSAGELNNNAAMIAPDGYLYFGGNKGIAVFHPQELREDAPAPAVILTALKLFNKKVPVAPGDEQAILHQAFSHQKEIVLSYDQTLITIDFAALHYPFSKSIFYSYILESYNDHWIESGNVGTANFSNLPPGKYNLKVKAALAPNVENASYTMLSIVITPPFWKTIPAYALYTIIIVLIISGALRYYSERVKLQNSLLFEKKQRQLEHDLNEERLRFFTSFSHELKTPLTLILAPVEDLVAKAKSIEHKKSLGLVQKNAKYLLQLINKLLEFRKTEVGLNELKLAEYKLNPLLENWVNNYQHLAHKKKITLSYHAPEEDVYLWADLEKLQIMVYNLLSNAFKFTPKHGAVELRLFHDQTHAFIQVKDTGIGVAPAALPYIFDWYFKAGENHKKGTGIGLALTKRLAELHHGSVQVESRLSEGSVFTISLPLDQEVPLHLQQLADPGLPDQDYTLEIPNLPDPELLTETHECEEKVIHTNEGSREVLLLIDDNPGIIQYLTDLLKDEYHIINAHDGVQGLEKACQYVPDLIISDISMPGKDGIELCRSLKKNAATSHIPIILLTVNDSEESIKEGFEEGADQYITKPFNGQLLLTRTKSLLNKRRQLREYFLTRNSDVISAEDENSPLFRREKGFLEELEAAVLSRMDSDEMNVEAIAHSMGMSRTSLYRKIKAISGQNINEYIRTVKLKRAVQLMSENGLNVSQAAYEVGFSSVKYFRKLFKDQYGKLPSELKE